MKLLQNNVLRRNKLNCFEATQVLGGLAQILIWGSEIGKGGTWSFGIKGGPKSLGIYIYTPGIVMFLGFTNTKITK